MLRVSPCHERHGRPSLDMTIGMPRSDALRFPILARRRFEKEPESGLLRWPTYSNIPPASVSGRSVEIAGLMVVTALLLAWVTGKGVRGRHARVLSSRARHTLTSKVCWTYIKWSLASACNIGQTTRHRSWIAPVALHNSEACPFHVGSLAERQWCASPCLELDTVKNGMMKTRGRRENVEIISRRAHATLLFVVTRSYYQWVGALEHASNT